MIGQYFVAPSPLKREPLCRIGGRGSLLKKDRSRSWQMLSALPRLCTSSSLFRISLVGSKGGGDGAHPLILPDTASGTQ